MPTYVRWRAKGATYFFTVVTYRRQRILTGTLCRELLRKAIRSTQRRHPFDILAFDLLTDHLHCIWQLPDDEDDYLRHRDYIHLNPVKHGLVDKPEDWPWSSFHRHVRLGWLDAAWPGSTAVALPDIEAQRMVEA